jgi:hypothetical protein
MSDAYQTMSTLWISKEVRPELDVLAFAETERIGRTVTRTSLAREIFLWAFDQYRKAGSLRRLKSARLVFRDVLEAQMDKALESYRQGVPVTVKDCDGNVLHGVEILDQIFEYDTTLTCLEIDKVDRQDFENSDWPGLLEKIRRLFWERGKR